MSEYVSILGPIWGLIMGLLGARFGPNNGACFTQNMGLENVYIRGSGRCKMGVEWV